MGKGKGRVEQETCLIEGQIITAHKSVNKNENGVI